MPHIKIEFNRSVITTMTLTADIDEETLHAYYDADPRYPNTANNIDWRSFDDMLHDFVMENLNDLADSERCEAKIQPISQSPFDAVHVREHDTVTQYDDVKILRDLSAENDT